jgi:hypothetical protein
MWPPSFDQCTVACGFIAALAMFGLIISRKRSLEASDIGPFASAFLSGSNLPAALYLCWYGFSPDPLTVHTKLQGFEKYVAFAGLSFLLVNIVALWALLRRAHLQPSKGEREAQQHGMAPNTGPQADA